MCCTADAAGRTALAVHGPPTTVYNRFNRWSRRGRWMAIFQGRGAGHPEGRPVDRQHIDPDPACGGWRKRGPRREAIVARAAAGRPRSTPSATARRRLFGFLLTPGHWADVTAAYDLTAQLPARGRLIGDTGYDARKLRQDLAFRGIATARFRPIRPGKHQWPIDLDLYKQRNLVERMFNRLKDFRGSPPVMTSSLAISPPPLLAPLSSFGGPIESGA